MISWHMTLIRMFLLLCVLLAIILLIGCFYVQGAPLLDTNTESTENKSTVDSSHPMPKSSLSHTELSDESWLRNRSTKEDFVEAEKNSVAATKQPGDIRTHETVRGPGNYGPPTVHMATHRWGMGQDSRGIEDDQRTPKEDNLDTTSGEPGGLSSTQASVEPTVTSLPCEDGGCEQWDVRVFDFTSNPVGRNSASIVDIEAASVEDVLERGLALAEVSPVHLVFRGTAREDSTRCTWRGVARTLRQREAAIRFWLGLDTTDQLPSATEIERRFMQNLEVANPIYPQTVRSNFRAIASGGLTSDYVFLTCFIDYTVHEYILGSGASEITVGFDRRNESRSYDLYRLAHEAGEFGTEALMSEQVYQNYLNQIVSTVELASSVVLEGSESVVFLAPMGAHNAIAIEAWQTIAQWDVQMADDGTVYAVRYGTHQSDPEHTQTLANLKSRITTAAASDAFAGSRIANVSGVTQYYRDIGAYADITPDDGSTDTFTPAQPPEPYAPEPATLTATATGEETVDLSWGSVPGATGYHVQHRESGQELWEMVDASVAATTHTASGLWCNRMHEFRVGAYGDGTTYNTRVGRWSTTASATTATCSPQPPRFEETSYAFDVNVAALVGDSVGTVSAIDVNGDSVAYLITSGNETGKFSIDSSTGEITLAGPLGSSVDTTLALTVGATDGVSGTTTVTVTVTVTAVTCTNGTVVSNPESNLALVRDCETLLALRDALAGTGTLDWSLDTAITSWDGVRVGGTPRRVLELALVSSGLNGVLPPGLGELTGLRQLYMGINHLTGEIPSELGNLVELRVLFLPYNVLTGRVPRELGGLTNLTELQVQENWLTGHIPWELGDLPNLTNLHLSGNGFEGCLRPSLRRISSNDLAELGLPDCAEAGLVPAPESLTVTLADGVFTVTWSEVTGAARYAAQQRIAGPEDDEWTSLPSTEGTSATFSPADVPACGTTYEFRVRSYGDGTTYVADWGAESGVESVTTGACNRDPEFDPTSYAFSVAEDASEDDVVGTVSAADPDDGDTVSYEITAGNEDGKFAIDAGTGEITVTGALNYENVSTYTLTVEASDGQDGSASASVEIEVTDVAEDAPPAPEGLSVALAGGVFTVTWSEVTGAARYEAQHRIAGSEDDEWTSLPSTEGTSATFSPADVPACGTTYEFRVRSYGDGTTYVADWGAESGVETVTTDACNRDPEFDPTSYAFSVAEDASEDDVVGTVSATDPDDGDTVSYEITAGNEDGKFAIDAGTGEITVMGALNYENVSAYTLTVEASDGRGGSASASVEIEVTDVAEDAPPAPEGLSVALAGGVFTVTWSEVTGAARYEAQHRIAGSEDDEWTSLPSTEGTSATFSPADVPACGTTYEFRVRSYGDGTTYVADWGAESGVETVTTDACNRDPEFDPASYAFSVAEDASVGDAVGTVSAADPDDGDTVSYEITAGNEDGKFAIDAGTGEITVAGALNYENVSTYTLTVEASDGRGGSASASVEIEVMDVAEDAPPAPEGLSVALADGVFTVTWSEVTGAARYEAQHRIAGSEDDEWTSLPATEGTSATYSPAGGTECGTTYEFRVRSYGDGTTYVADWGAESGVETVTTGACNRDPEFAPTSYEFSIREDASVGDAVGTVSAVDPDDGDTVSYEITAGNEDGKFVIDAGTGEITVAGALNYENDSTYTLTVEASDGQGGTSTASFIISVIEASCSNGIAVPRPDENTGLVGDCTVLLSIRDTLAGDATLDWSPFVAITDWSGLSFGGSPMRVTKLLMISSGLSGSIPAEMGRLSELQDLTLVGNSLTGEMPSELGNLARLTRLNLALNMLSGEIPSELGTLSNLQSLTLSSNQLTGEIPSELGTLSNLRSLTLSSNRLAGEIPSELGGLTNLRTLLLNDNRLTGEIPPELGELVNLQTIWLSRNLLAGEIPSEFGGLTALRNLVLHNNRLTGAIPWQLGNLSDLNYLILSGNQLEGCVPPVLRRVETNDVARLGLPDCAQEGPAPAPEGLSVSLAGDTFSISWSAVTGASRYEVQYRTVGSDNDWESVATTDGTSATFSPAGGPVCGTTYEFRVRSHGDASTYAAGWGPESDAVSVSTSACDPSS